MAILKEAQDDAPTTPSKGATTEEQASRSALAPDGLPWPQGYFDRIPPKQTLEEAVAMYGVRPSHYFHGRPGYTEEEASRPEFKGVLPDEPVELQELWQREWAEWEAKGRPGQIVIPNP